MRTSGTDGNLAMVGTDGVNGAYNRDLNNFGPRVGFAWNAHSNTIVRGSYGIFYDYIPQDLMIANFTNDAGLVTPPIGPKAGPAFELQFRLRSTAARQDRFLLRAVLRSIFSLPRATWRHRTRRAGTSTSSRNWRERWPATRLRWQQGDEVGPSARCQPGRREWQSP